MSQTQQESETMTDMHDNSETITRPVTKFRQQHCGLAWISQLYRSNSESIRA